MPFHHWNCQRVSLFEAVHKERLDSPLRIKKGYFQTLEFGLFHMFFSGAWGLALESRIALKTEVDKVYRITIL
jgi:hypothetical protein